MTDSDELRQKLLKICHKFEDKEFMAVHGKCDMDVAAIRCAKRVKALEALINQHTAEVEAGARMSEIKNALDKRYITDADMFLYLSGRKKELIAQLSPGKGEHD